MIKLTVMLIAAAMSASASGAPIGANYVEISPAAIRSHVAFLADDLLQGREAGTVGYEIAARYVAARFEAIGLEPAGENGQWFQPVRLHESSLDHSNAAVTIAQPNGEQRRWQSGTDVVVAPSPLEPQLDVEAAVVFAGFGLDAPAQGFNDYRGLDVKGKIVAVLMGTPRGTPSEVGAHLAAEKRRMAEQNGAIGIVGLETRIVRKLFPWSQRLEEATLPRMTWAGSDGKPFVEAPNIRVIVSMNETSTQALFTGARRSFDSILREADRKNARPKGFELATRLRVQSTSRSRALTSPNVLGMLPGSDPHLKNQVVLMMAHLDHIGVRPLKLEERSSEPIDRIMNGAADNASGIATLLEVAAALSAGSERPRRSILFFANTAEEKGLLGAEYFAHQPTIPLQRIAGVVNLDMPLLTYDFADVVAFGAEHSTLGVLAEEAAAAGGAKLSPDFAPEQGIFTRSDHYALVKKGIPAVFFATGFANGGEQAWTNFLEQHYHQASDDMALPFNWEAAARFARINRDLVMKIANADEPARWYEGDFFGDTFAPDAPKARRETKTAQR